jgi:hypothetical protein
MRYKLRGLGQGPHAVYCQNGKRSFDEHLPEGSEVKDATDDDKAHVPVDLKPIAGNNDVGLSLVGIFVVPDRGVAALYGCVPVPIDQCSKGDEVIGAPVD